MSLKDIELYLLDMDGTIYFDDYLIDGAYDFIQTLIKKNKKYVFLTNNSSKNENDYINKLKRLNIPCDKENIFTSGMATGIYLQTNYPKAKVYLVGTKALYNELDQYGVKLVDENPDIVLIGFDRELTYNKLEKACEFLDNGAIFLATNCDLVCPIKGKKFIPDCGSMCNMLTVATKKEPYYIGKPNPYMINLLSKKFNIPNSKIAVIGDRVYTDIASGYNAKANTICVLSGESTMKTITDSDIKPDYIYDSVKDLIDLI